MCKHVVNAQVSIRAPCCKRWFDCAQCHAELTDHDLEKKFIMIFGCKKCKHVFRKDMQDFEESDEYCPKCDNHYYVKALSQDKVKKMKKKVVVAVDKRETSSLQRSVLQTLNSGD